jgi:DNA repair exonuclease SbcCD ATPase subunit
VKEIKMSDLLNKLNSQQKGQVTPKTAEGAANSAAPVQPDSQSTPRLEVDRGDDLLRQVKTKAHNASSADSNYSGADSSHSNKVEPSGTDNAGVDDPDTWTKDSAFKEVKKLREENKTYRLKYQEQIESLKMETEARMQAKEDELKSAMEAQKELSKIKAEQEDKKRSLEEKLAHREAKAAELQAVMDAKENEYRRKMSELEAMAHTYKAKEAAEKQIYVQRISEEIDKIPEKYREIANMIVKGAGEDPRDGLLALNEAKLRNIFEDKTVVVNHSVPGASDGARVSKTKMDEMQAEKRAQMNSGQKIRSALDAIKSGTSNTAFRMK